MKNRNQIIVVALSLFFLIGTSAAQQERKPLKYKIRQSNGSELLPPIVFLMHGYGGNNKQFNQAMKMIDDRFLIVSMNGPHKKWFGLMNLWFEYKISNGDTTSNQEQFDHSINRVLFTMGVIKQKYNYDPDKIYIGGYSQGAIVAYKLALLYPEKFAGIVIHSARLPVEYSIKSPSDIYQNLDMLIIHGNHDSVLTSKWATQGVKLFKRLGAEVEYYGGNFGHERTEDSISQMSRWLNERIDGK